MGEVRAKVRIINAVDEALARRGRLRPDRVRSYEVQAVVDTGASRTVLPSHVARRLGLAIRDRGIARCADGRRRTVGMTEPLVVEIDGHGTVDEAIVLGDEVLIGQTVLQKLDLLVDCEGRRLVPNPRRPASRI